MAATPSGKDKLQKYTRLYLAEFDLSGDSRTFSEAIAAHDDVDMTGWSDLVMNGLADRLQVGLTGYQAIMNPAAAGAFTQLSAGTSSPILSLCFGGGGAPAAGDPAYLLPAVQLSGVTGPSSRTNVITADFNLDQSQVSDSFTFPFGYVLNGDTSLTTTTNGTSVDLYAAGTTGFTAHLHIIASSGGSWAFTIEQSSDDGSGDAFATLGTFTADGSAVTSESLTGASTVEQYVRFVATRTSGTVTAVCTFVRN